MSLRFIADDASKGCSKTHCPSFVRGAALLKEKGVDVIACTAVNDAFVLDAWAESQHAKGKVRNQFIFKNKVCTQLSSSSSSCSDPLLGRWKRRFRQSRWYGP